MYYVPQSIPSYTAMEMQGFRKGNCKPYENRVLVNANSYAMPMVMFKRLTSGAVCTVTLVTILDVDLYTMTTTTRADFDLDDPISAYEMSVFPAGAWSSLGSPAPGNYYLRIEDGTETHYTEAFYIEQTSEAFPQCSDGWVKLTWTDGRCIVADTSTDGVTPVLAYPDAEQSFFLFLRASLSNPEWETDEVGDADASGVFVANQKRASKRWRLEGYPVSEAVIDALQSSALFETVTIEFPTLPAFTGVRDIKVVPKWEVGGCYATFEYSFSTDYLLKQGCC